jgi:uncharacterized protein YbjT (DUF2867 family)
VLVRDPVRAARLGKEVQTVTGDLDLPETLPGAMHGADAVYLVSQANQVEGAVLAAKQAGVRHIVRQSTMEAGFCPPLGSGRWHREAELVIERAGMAWTHLRPTMLMVNTSAWWGADIRADWTVRFPGGDGRLSPVHPRDVAAVACAVLTHPGHAGHAYDVTGPELLTIGQMVAILSRVLDHDIRYIDVPEAEAGAWMARSGAPPALIDSLVETLAGIRANKFAHVADTVSHLTGRPGHSYEEWCREHADTFSQPGL